MKKSDNMLRKKKKSEKKIFSEPSNAKIPEGTVPMCETPDEKLIDDVKQFISIGLISNAEAISYALALTYNSLKEEDRKELINDTLKISKMINDFYAESIADKPGSTMGFMYALSYMLANMNGTLMFDDAWKRMVEKGIECHASFIRNVVVPVTVKEDSKKKDNENRGYV
jgi:hypothetical protein